MNTTFSKNIQSYTTFTSSIVEYFHTQTRTVFKEIIAKLQKLEKEYTPPSTIHMLTHNIEEFAQAMEEHLIKEETILFPLINAIDTTTELTYKSVLLRPIAKMEEEHKEHSIHIEAIQNTLTSLRNDDNPNINDIIDEIEALIALTEEHIYVEDILLFTTIKGM